MTTFIQADAYDAIVLLVCLSLLAYITCLPIYDKLFLQCPYHRSCGRDTFVGSTTNGKDGSSGPFSSPSLASKAVCALQWEKASSKASS